MQLKQFLLFPKVAILCLLKWTDGKTNVESCDLTKIKQSIVNRQLYSIPKLLCPQRKMLDQKTFDLVDKFYGEFHRWQPHGQNSTYIDKIVADLKSQGLFHFHNLSKMLYQS